jgi:hypothetical protein
MKNSGEIHGEGDLGQGASRLNCRAWGWLTLVSLAVFGAGCATTRLEIVTLPVVTTPPELRLLSGAIVSVVPEQMISEPGFRVTCKASVEEIVTKTDFYEKRKQTIRRTSDPVEWNHVYTTYGMTGDYLGAGKGFNCSQSVGFFTKTRKFTWRRVFAPSLKVGFFPVGASFRDGLGNNGRTRFMPYTFASDAFDGPLMGRFAAGLVIDAVALACDVGAMGVAGVCDVVNLGVLDTTLPASYDVVTMTGAGAVDGVCLVGVTVADTAVSALALVPNAICGVGDALYPSAFRTNITVVSTTKGKARIARYASIPDYTQMSVTLLAGGRLIRKSLDQDGTVWITSKDLAPSGSGELMLWDNHYRVWGARRAVVSATPVARDSVRRISPSFDRRRYRK